MKNYAGSLLVLLIASLAAHGSQPKRNILIDLSYNCSPENGAKKIIAHYAKHENELALLTKKEIQDFLVYVNKTSRLNASFSKYCCSVEARKINMHLKQDVKITHALSTLIDEWKSGYQDFKRALADKNKILIQKFLQEGIYYEEAVEYILYRLHGDEFDVCAQFFRESGIEAGFLDYLKHLNDLKCAIRNDDIQKAHNILKTTAIDLNKPLAYTPNPLAYACFHGKHSFIELFIQNGADINQDIHGNGTTPLMMLAEYRDRPATAKFLLQHGSDIDKQDTAGYTSLMYAWIFCKPLIFEALLDTGANISVKNADDLTVIDIMRRHLSNASPEEKVKYEALLKSHAIIEKL